MTDLTQNLQGDDPQDEIEWAETLAEESAGDDSGLADPALINTCHTCGHVHQGHSECGMQMSGGRICHCEIGIPF